MSNLINRAKAIARIAHAGMKYGAADYFAGHVEKVVARVKADPDARPGDIVVAYLHDVVEDTAVTFTDLIDAGFNAAIVNSIKKITRNPDIEYFEYIRGIAADEDDFAYMVKYHDIKENLMNSEKSGSASMINRYTKALVIMEWKSI